MKAEYNGVLEIDYDRGVVYFHTNNPGLIQRFGTQTLLRIHGLTLIENRPIDIRAGSVHLQKKLTQNEPTEVSGTEGPDRDPPTSEGQGGGRSPTAKEASGY